MKNINRLNKSFLLNNYSISNSIYFKQSNNFIKKSLNSVFSNFYVTDSVSKASKNLTISSKVFNKTFNRCFI